MPIKKAAIKRPLSLCDVVSTESADGRALQRGYVFSLRAFFTLTNSELNLLTFGEGFETAGVDRAEMHEKIGTAFRGDESKTFGFVEPFDGTGADVRHGN